MTDLNVKRMSPSQNIASFLDAKDGKINKQISASVWNNFVEGKGGKKIKNSISLENARKSIETYLARNSKITGKDAKALAAEWLTQLFDSSSAPKVPNTNDIKLDNNLFKKYFPKQTPKEQANSLCKFMKGETETFIPPNKEEVAQVVHEISKNFKGKMIPTTLASSMVVGSIYPSLLQRAEELGIKTNYNKNTEFGNTPLEKCKNKWKACIDLKNKILEAEKNNNTTCSK